MPTEQDERSFKWLRNLAWAAGGVAALALAYAQITAGIEALRVRIDTEGDAIRAEMKAVEERMATRVDDLTGEMQEIWNWRNSWVDRVLPLDAKQDAAIEQNSDDIDDLERDVEKLEGKHHK